MVELLSRRARPVAGMTILETVVAGGLLMVAVLPLVGFVGSLTRSTDATRSRVLAHVLSRAMIERFRLEPLSALATRAATPEQGRALVEKDDLLALSAGQVLDLARVRRLVRTLELRRIAGFARTGVLTARVDWEEQGQPRHYELATLVVDDRFPTGRCAGEGMCP